MRGNKSLLECPTGCGSEFTSDVGVLQLELALQMQFQQADLQGQPFLGVCVQPALELLHDP